MHEVKNSLKAALGIGMLLVTMPLQAEWFKQQREIMGTLIGVEIWHGSDTVAKQCSEKVFAEMHRIDGAMSPYREDSELTQINRLAAERPVKASDELIKLLADAEKFSRLTEGAFDITFASVGYMYDYRNRIRPSDRAIEEKLPAINYRHVMLDRNAKTVRFKRKGVRIDLGGIAKGYAVDQGIEILKNCDVTRALVSAGGDSRIIGDRPVDGSKEGRPWMMGVRNPRDRKDVAVVLPLSNTAISTSGDYERFFVEDGERYHHILSPATGKSVTETWSATVIGPDATTTDALSTSLFVLGREKGMALIESLPEIDAVIIDAKGNMHYSTGLLAPQSDMATTTDHVE